MSPVITGVMGVDFVEARASLIHQVTDISGCNASFNIAHRELSMKRQYSERVVAVPVWEIERCDERCQFFATRKITLTNRLFAPYLQTLLG